VGVGLSSVEALGLEGNYLDEWPRLRFLGLADNCAGDAGATAWVPSSGSAGLHLALDGTDCGEETRRRLRASALPGCVGPVSPEGVYFEALGFDQASG
jgi:hypothetical protein